MENNTFSTDWMQGLTDLQRKIWNEWATMASSSFSGTPGPENPMQWFQQAVSTKQPGDPMQWFQQATAHQGGDPMQWFQKAMGTMPGMDSLMSKMGIQSPESMAVRNMMGSSESFMRMGQEIFKVFQSMGEGSQAGDSWTTLLEKNIQQAKDLFSGVGGGPGMNPAQNPMAAWNQPLQAWSDMMKNNQLMSNDLLNSFTQQTNGNPLENWTQQMMGMPGLGINREKQERMQSAIQDVMAYQKANEQFQQLTNQMNVKALDLLHKKLLERGSTNEPLSSMRDIYVLWVDCSEEANAEFVRSTEYQDSNARMVNTMVRVQQNMQTMLDENLSAFNMPTRKEINSAHKQVQLLKRRVRVLEDELKSVRGKDQSAEISAIRDDLERLDIRSLKKELADLKKQVNISQSPPKIQSTPKETTEKKAPAKTRAKPQAEAAKKGE